MKKFKCGIYFIEAISGNPNRIGWKYVGKVNGRYDRKYYHFNDLKNKNHHSIKLQRYYNKYGKDSLKWKFFFECPEDELNFWEVLFIKRFDSKGNGFNMTLGGENPPENNIECSLFNMTTKVWDTCNSIKDFAHKYDLSEGCVGLVLKGDLNYTGEWYNPRFWTPKYYEVISPNAENFEVIEGKIGEFCRQHDLNESHFYMMITKKVQTCKGWKRPDSRLKRNKPDSSDWGREFKLISPTGNLICGKNLKKFARDNNLTIGQLWKVISKKINYHKGWRLFEDDIKLEQFDKNKHSKPRKFKTYQFINPKNEVVEVNNLQEFCKNNNLSYTFMSCLSSGSIGQHKKWRRYIEGAEIRPVNLGYVKNPNNEIFEVKVIKYFAQEHKLCEKSLSQLLRGIIKKHNGWIKYQEGMNELDLEKFKFVNPSGDILGTSNMKEFADKHGLSADCLGHLHRGNIKKHKGWTKYFEVKGTN